MRKSWVMCVLLGAMAWGQMAPTQPGPPGKPAAQMPDTSASVPADAAVITVYGVCAPKPAAAAKPAAGTAGAAKPAAKTPPADCKTVITKAEFEKMASGVAPALTPQLRRQLASVLPRLIAMSSEAEKKGLDKSERFKETMKFAKMQILTNELQRGVQEEAAKVPETKIADYYKTNQEAYEQYDVDRLFVPRSKQAEATDDDKDEKLTEEQQKAKEEKEKAKQAASEEELTNLAKSLRARAAAGEDFVKLQKEAFDAAGMKIDSPTVNLPKIRRTGLPPGHTAVFELKPGEISEVISDAGGHYVYKLNKKDVLPLEQVKEEIHSMLQNQAMRDAMDKYQNSFHADTNEAYFGPAAAPGAAAPHGMMRPKPAPMAAPPAQTPAQAPATKPN